VGRVDAIEEQSNAERPPADQGNLSVELIK
jgi:hypothetical protein